MFECNRRCCMTYLRCSAETAKINLTVFLIHVVLRSGAEMFNFLQSKKYIHILCFHSSGQHLCKFIATKESVYIRKEFNSHRTGLGHKHGRRFIVLGHNTAAMTSCENTQYIYMASSSTNNNTHSPGQKNHGWHPKTLLVVSSSLIL